MKQSLCPYETTAVELQLVPDADSSELTGMPSLKATGLGECECTQSHPAAAVGM